MTRLQPELVWVDGRFRRGLDVRIDPARGTIAAVVPRGDGPEDRAAADVDSPARGDRAGGDERVVPLPDLALIPGFVNAHSHAFQRLIRGRTQTRPAERPDADFWSWREAMYRAALSLEPDGVYHVARFAFLEMLRTGITAVGEFHYLHHRRDGSPYTDPNRLAWAVIRAAGDVGIRIALLNVCYANGGIGRPLEPRQRRFRASTLDAFLARTARLHDDVRAAPAYRELTTVGVAPHSVRAVPRDWLPEIRGWAVERDAPVHMHVAERPAEVEACLEAYGHRPVELLAQDGLLDSRFTAIHATHLTDPEVEVLGRSGAIVCACPTTERGLGDGFLRGLELVRAGAPIVLGTDSHTNLDFLEEMRLVEYNERLRRLQRVVITDAAGPDTAGPDPAAADDGRPEHHRVAPELLDMATRSGARSLRLDSGEIATGRWADLIAVDLDHHALAGWTDPTLAAMLTLSATPDVVRDVWVHGQRRLQDRHHEAEHDIARGFRRVAGPTHTP